MHMQPDFEKANEIYFRLGIIYKQQQKYSQSLEVGRIPLLDICPADSSSVLQMDRQKSTSTSN